MTRTQTVEKGWPPSMGTGFRTPLRIELAEGGLWVLLEDLVWVGSDGDLLVVRTGEETDFASVPRLLQALLPSADPRVVRAAVVHDFLCRELNDYRRVLQDWPGGDMSTLPKSPAFSAVDADAIFEKIMRDEGAGWWMRNVGWLGVRLGALWNPARRAGWLSTLPRVAGLSTLFLAAASAILAGLAWLIPL